MKFLALLAVIGFASAVRLGGLGHLKWQPDHEYVYTYKGRLLTGIPELAEKHFSGMGIHAKIHLQVLSPSRVMLKLTEVQHARVNEVLEPYTGNQEGHNWRHLKLPHYAPVPSETMRLLGQPTLFEVSEESGKVRSVTVSREEPEWSVNFKKALIVLFQTQGGSMSVSSSIRSNSISQSLSEIESSGKPITSYWTTMEQSVEGECETRYELYELPESTILDEVVSEESRVGSGIVRSELQSECPANSKLFELIKTRNHNKCTERSSFNFYKPGGYQCQPGFPTSQDEAGNCAGMYTRSSVTRYIVCGTSDYDYVIVKILNEGELNQDLLGFKSEKMLTGTRQVLKLVSKNRRSSYSSSVEQPSSPITLNTLFYEYSLKKGPESLKRDLVTEQSILKGLPILQEGIKSGKKPVIKEQMKSLIREIVTRDLFTLEGLPETQVSIKALGLAKGFAALTTSEIESLYHSLKSEYSGEKHQVYKNIFFDTCIMGGTVPSVRFVKKMILEGEMTPGQAESVLLSLTRSLVTPTTHILEEIFELVTSSKVKQMSQNSNLYNSAVLGYSTLIEKACLAENRKTSYPTFVFGKFCHHDSAVVTQRWIPYLTKHLMYEQSTPAEKKNVYVVALGLLNHKNVLPPLFHVLEEPKHHSPLLRSLAVLSLTKTGRQHPHHVLPVLSSIFTNRAERTEIRAAAFATLMKLNPDMYILQKISALTWIETDLEILKMVNTAFYSISHSVSMQDMKYESASLVRRVRLLYPLIKKTGGKFPTTGAVYTNDFLKHLNVAYEKSSIWASTKDSSMPTDYYSKINYFLDNYRYTPLEYGFHLRGTGSLIKEILDIITGKSYSSVSEPIEGEITRKLTGEWRKVVQKLAIEPRRESDRPEGAFMINLFETTPIFKTFAKESSSALKEKVRSILKNPASLLRGNGNDKISFQRMINLAPTILNLPSDMGLPISMEVHMPMTMSVQGHMVPEDFSLSKVSLKTKLHAMATVQYTGWVGTVCPISGDYLVTGIDQHASLNLPNELYFGLDRHEQKMTIRMKTLSRPITSVSGGIGSSSGAIDLFHYHVRPFTTVQKIWDIKPLTKGSHFKIIKNLNYSPNEHQEPREESRPFLSSLGLGLTYDYLTTVPHSSVLPSLSEKFRMFNRSPMNFFRFMFVSAASSPSRLPSIRQHRFAVRYHPEKATTKEIDLTFKYGFASKQTPDEPIMYKTIEVVSESGKVVPLDVQSRPIGEASKHHGRQQKIREIIQKNELRTGYGVSFSVSAKLLGSVERTFDYTFLGSFGKSAEMKTKWDVKVESDSGEKVCVNGHVVMPLSSAVYSVHQMQSQDNTYEYESKFAYGRSCNDKVIKVTGHAKTSEKQKEISRTSPEAKEYLRLKEKRVPLARLSKVAESVRRQATLLDEVKYEIEYHRIPAIVPVVAEKIADFVKIYNLPYLAFKSYYSSGCSESSCPLSSSYLERLSSSLSSMVGGSSSEIIYEPLSAVLRAGEPVSGKVVMKIHFHPERRTYSVVIKNQQSGKEILKLEDLPIPVPLSYYIPYHSSRIVSRSAIYPVVQPLVGASYYPVCKVEGSHMSTYDNVTLPLRKLTDDCYTLLSGDCGHKSYEWGVLVSKSSMHSDKKVVKVFVKNIRILLVPESSEHITVKVEGMKTPISQGRSTEIKDPAHNSVLATIYRSSDNTITVKSTYVNVVFNGKLIEVLPSPIYKGKLCGLCGNYNGDKSDEMVSPQQCLLSKPELLMAAYAVPKSEISSESSSLSRYSSSSECIASELREQLRVETSEKCVKVKTASGISSSHRSNVIEPSSSSSPSYYGSGSSSYSSYMYDYPSYVSDEVSSSEVSSSSSSIRGSCYKRSHHVYYRHGKTCVSNLPYMGCGSECKATEEVIKEVSFHCMATDSPRTSHILERVRRGEVIPELMVESRDIDRAVPVPESCKPTYSGF